MTKEQSYTRFWEGSKRMWITFLFFSFIMGNSTPDGFYFHL